MNKEYKFLYWDKPIVKEAIGMLLRDGENFMVVQNINDIYVKTSSELSNPAITDFLNKNCRGTTLIEEAE